MRPHIPPLIQIISNTLSIIEPIYEFGSLQVPDQIGIADLRPLFANKDYVGCDMREGYGVDRILNLHNIDLPASSVGTAICIDTLEHVEYPHVALKELERILKPNGTLIITSVMNFPIHNYPFDYWRFTPEAFRSLLKPFRDSFVGYAGDSIFPHTVIGIGFKNENPDLKLFKQSYQVWQANQPKSLKAIVKLFMPPILLKLKRRFLA